MEISITQDIKQNCWSDFSGFDSLRLLLSGFKTLPDGRIDLNGWEDGRASSIWLPDYQGNLTEIPGGTPVIVDSGTGRLPRVVRNYLLRSGDMSLHPSPWWHSGSVSVNSNAGENEITFGTSELAYMFQSVTVNAGSTVVIALDLKAASGYEGKKVNLVLKDSGGSPSDFISITLTANYKRYQLALNFPSGGTIRFQLQENDQGVVFYARRAQFEVDVPVTSEYVPTGVSTGIAYYTTSNANTVDANGVVTEAVGSPLPVTGEWVFEHWPGSTNHINWSNDLTQWTNASNGQLVVTFNGAYSAVIGLGGYSNNRLNIEGVTVAANAALAVSFYLRAVSSAGTIRVISPRGTGYGWWDIDVSLISNTDFEYITADHPAVTVQNAFVADPSGLGGLRIYNAAGDTPPIDFDIHGCQIEEKPFSTPVIQTSGAAATRDRCQIRQTYDTFKFNQDEGMCILRFRPGWEAKIIGHQFPLFTTKDDDMQNVLYFNTGTNDKAISSYDKTQASTAYYPQAFSKNDELLAAVRWNVKKNELQVGVRNVTKGESWTWDATINQYDGSFDTGTYLGLFSSSLAVYQIRTQDIAVYNKDKGTQWIEEHF